MEHDEYLLKGAYKIPLDAVQDAYDPNQDLSLDEAVGLFFLDVAENRGLIVPKEAHVDREEGFVHITISSLKNIEESVEVLADVLGIDKMQIVSEIDDLMRPWDDGPLSPGL